jgi:Polyketide cyclase / dehydrase and lipid transport
VHTINRAETRSIAIAAPPRAVHSYLADARNLPTWAPGFAPRIRPDGGSWRVTAGDREFNIVVLAEPSSRSVDVVSASDHSRGLFARVLPNAGGSELVFTLLFPPETPERAIEAQLTTLDSELTAVRDAVGG